MKRMILAPLIGLLASGAYASDLSYGGPYSQMKVKLCSDTPPSRSILPDGSLICDDNPPTSDTYCTGGFVYADTDLFNCGSQVEQDGDLNNNGIPDNDEDWDGDGLVNGVDPNPYLNDNAELDEDNNGIPDKLDPFFDLYKASRPEFVKCDAQDPRCQSTNQAIYSLSNANRDLTRIINHMAEGNTSKQFTKTLENLRQTMTFQEVQTRKELSGLEHAIKNIDRGVDNSEIINAGFVAINNAFEEADGDLSVIKSMLAEVNTDVETNRTIGQSNMQIMGNVNNNVADIKRSLSSGVGGLTAQQANQLKNAAKASANQKLIKNMQSSVDFVAEGFGMLYSDVTDSIDSLNPKFQQLSDQISAISSGTSTVDLSGVESSIGALSDKIDGIEGGGNGEGLAEISSKLDGLATGVTDIGDLLKGVDASKAGIDGTCIQGGTCQGFYESAYEGDLSTVVSSQLDAMKTSIVDPFVSSFGNIDLSGAQRPKFGLPVPFYGYMSFDDYIDMDWIFGFLRFIFLASTAFYCRQIIFGG
ncbi:hypothetical protein [Vibrio crassostreae]|uniref:hypothetical protein n=1 Tax=Vibrio crassostreae TaxID=246167 RepID=UPI001B307DFC|nr:hypothetical protein [Vibrio crassostreae]CAK2528127.1 Methyl-accepting chemotaxis protein [Vibrio crassostreae]CAK3532423.1 Methyl-accepting chemotaxis protein [Vibrio crassostreae]